MENASKALLMAGGILIALLILGALVLLMTNLQTYQNANNDMTKNSQIAEFNNQFEPYNKNNLTLMELKSVYNKIESNNAQHPEYPIEHNIGSALRSAGLSDANCIKFESANGFREIEDTYKQKLKFKCLSDSIEYKNPDGRISKMHFGVN